MTNDTFKSNFNVSSSIFSIDENKIEEVIHEPEDEVDEVSDFQD